MLLSHSLVFTFIHRNGLDGCFLRLGQYDTEDESVYLEFKMTYCTKVLRVVTCSVQVEPMELVTIYLSSIGLPNLYYKILNRS